MVLRRVFCGWIVPRRSAYIKTHFHHAHMNLYMNINGHVRGGGINKLVKLQSKRLPARSAQKHTAERDVVCQVRDSALQLPIGAS